MRYLNEFTKKSGVDNFSVCVGDEHKPVTPVQRSLYPGIIPSTEESVPLVAYAGDARKMLGGPKVQAGL